MDDVQILIEGSGGLHLPILYGDITWKTERKGSPGELTFTCIKDGKLSFPEGAEVKMTVNGTDVFHGYVFTKSRDKAQHIKVVCYDQLRYLKNKDTIIYAGWTCTELIDHITKMYKATFNVERRGDSMVGVANTEYVVGSEDEPRAEINVTLFDMILNSLDETVYNTGKLFVLYDDCGKIRLKSMDDMKVDYFITEDVMEDFDYSSTIDENVYNVIKMYVENEDGERTFYITENATNVDKWGLLQYHEKAESEEEVQQVSSAVAYLYGDVNRTLTVKGLIGDVKVRAGSIMPISQGLGDLNLNHYLMAESVTHKWNNGNHTMDIQLSGKAGRGDFR